MAGVLTEGKKTNKELAAWFGITANTFGAHKKRKLEELKCFANFHLEGTKVVIDEVLEPIYTKAGSVNYQKVKNEIDPTWSETGLDTCSRVAQTIYEKLSQEDEDFNLRDRTVYDYTRKGRDELYGKPFSGSGEIGTCEYIWCKRTEDGYEFLTDDEIAIRNKLIKKYFGDATEKQLLVKQMVQDGELKREDAFDYLNEITGMTDNKFLIFLKELQDQIGCQIVKGTYVRRSAFN